LIDAVEAEIESQIEIYQKSHRRKAIANSKLIYVENDKIALDLIDEYGPEHFIVCVKDEDFTLITLVMQDRFYKLYA
jgi:histidinol dehydrogenase